MKQTTKQINDVEIYIKTAKLLKLCTRCNHVWLPKTENPKQCPKCHSPYWNKPRRRKTQ